MTKKQAAAALHITQAEIADLARVSLSAVSNWTKRYTDFPQPAADTAGRPQFLQLDVEQWLRRHDKWVGRPGVEHHLWQILNSLRASGLTEETLLETLTAVTTVRYVAYVPQDAHNAAYGATPDPEAWDAAWRRGVGDRLPEVREVAARIEAAVPSLRDVLLPPLRQAPHQVEYLIDLLDDVRIEDSAQFLESVLSMHRRATGRGGLECTTPEALTELIIDLARPVEFSVYDGAAGSGGFLLAAARVARRSLELFGQELNEGAWRLANQRMILHQLNGRIARGDTLRDDAHAGREMQTVLLDPPYGVRNWGGDQAAYDRRWPFGAPPANRADFAWIQQALTHLRPGGRAFVLLPSASLSRGGAEARIRQQLLEAGAVEAVIDLPRASVPRASIPVALWVLARPGDRAEADHVLLVHAAVDDSGSFAGRAKEVVDLYRSWRARSTVADVGWAATPSRSELLRDGNLTPSRWIRAASTDADKTGVLEELRSDAGRLANALDALQRAQGVQLDGVASSTGPVERVCVGDLVSGARLSLIRALRVPREERSDSGDVALITPQQVRAGLPVRAADCAWISDADMDPLPHRTQPGDVVVLADGPRIHAAVVADAGAIVAAPLWVLRISGDWIDPAYLAACLSSDLNHRHLVGSTIPRAPIRQLEIPLLPLAAQRALIQQLQAVQNLQRRATDVAASAETIARRLINGVAAGALDVDAPTEHNQAARA